MGQSFSKWRQRVSRKAAEDLFSAIRKDRLMEAEQLLKEGDTMVNYPSSKGWTSLHAAIMCRDSRILELVLNSEDVDIHRRVPIPEDPDMDHGYTAAHFAAFRPSDDPEFLQRVVSKGASPSTLAKHNVTPMFLAVNFGHPKTVKALLQYPIVNNKEHLSIKCGSDASGRPPVTALELARRLSKLDPSSERLEVVETLERAFEAAPQEAGGYGQPEAGGYSQAESAVASGPGGYPTMQGSAAAAPVAPQAAGPNA